MKTVYKYVLEVVDDQTLSLPIGSQVLSVATQDDDIVLYALVDPDQPTTIRYGIRIHGTGHPISNIDGHAFLGTVNLYGGRLMFHVFWKGATL
jgi:hypothetical protein